MKLGVGTKKNATVTLNLEELIDRYKVSNSAEGMSPKTICWYTANLKAFIRYLEIKHNPCDLSAFNIDMVRNYILYLRDRPRFQGHPYIPAQTINTLSQIVTMPRTNAKGILFLAPCRRLH